MSISVLKSIENLVVSETHDHETRSPELVKLLASLSPGEAVNPRRRARYLILATANSHTNRGGFTYRMKHLQAAVSACRSRNLLPEDIYTTAGFNPR